VTAEVHVALLTPTDDAGLLDERALGAHVEWLAAAGVDGVLVAGTTGEAPLLDDDEIVGAVARAAEAGAGRLQVVAHVGRPGTRATIRLARQAVHAGATAVAAVVPYFFSLGDEELLRHYAALADALPELPVLAYSIPDRTHNHVSAELFERLLEHGVAGLKDSTKSPERHREYLEVARRHEGALVYMGSDGLALSALREGSSGLMSAIANAAPEPVVGLRDAVAREDWPEAERLQEEMLGLRSASARQRPLSFFKQEVARRLAGAAGGYPTGVRSPLGAL
jgi:dihydrodipicolinate synthase/N-acetylneuraminate lyase